jgi:hypothetical protein
MKTALLAACCLIALGGSSVPSLAVEEAARLPRISISPEKFDFGSVLPNQELFHGFVVRNVGSADLVLEKPTTSCGCTVVDGYSSLVKPGTSTTLRVKLKTPPTAGRLQKSVLVRSNDPARATVELKVEATVGAATQ